MEIVLLALAFVAGCVTWNYLGPQAKTELRIEEKQIGADTKDKL